ncbi:MAG: two-component system response regulator [Gammaproteobacteria bacterium]
MQRILVIERSATLRHALGKHLCDQGYQVDHVGAYDAGLDRLRRHRRGGTDYSGIVVGWPTHTDPQADEFLSLLEDPDGRAIAVLVLAHETGTALREWAANRPGTALVLWDNYGEAGVSLSKLLTPPVPSVATDQCAEKAIRILFVDDSPSVRGLFRRLLRGKGYRTETACSVAEGMELALQSSFDIAIIDYFMPEATGDVLCRKLREHPQTHHIMSAIITSTYLDQVIKDCLDAGAVDCMFKSEANELFLARVAAMERTIRVQQSIEAERQRLAGILSSVGEGVYGVDPSGSITFINPAARQILGYRDEDQLEGKEPQSLFHYADERGMPIEPRTCFLRRAYEGGSEIRSWETVFWHRSGKPIPVECTVYPLTIQDRREGSVVAFRDISERKTLEERLRWQATHDPLTELLNRRYFEEQLEQEVARLRRSSECSALLYIDLDRFKYINDTAGHTAGDRLLIEVAHQLRGPLRESDFLARLGGDEFAVILRNVDPGSVYTAADKFRSLLNQYTFSYGGKQYRIDASIGVALIDRDSQSPGDVLANADIACHIAKQTGRNQTHVFEGEQDTKNTMDLELGWNTRLRDALQNDQFVLHYQPIVPMDVIGVSGLPDEPDQLWRALAGRRRIDPIYLEVLVRLKGPDGVLISPHAFLPTAERFNFMHEIDVWVMTRALEELVRWQAHDRRVVLSINLSGSILDDKFVLPYIKGMLEDLRLDPGCLVFEITETSAIHNLEGARRFIMELRNLGCRFALDDFGSGFSSFSHLKHLPVDIIKIDGSFVQDMAHDPIDRAMVVSMNDIAHSLGRRTVAEYVESAAILRLLKECGVDYVQGDYLCRPLSSLEVAVGAGNPAGAEILTSSRRRT